MGTFQRQLIIKFLASGFYTRYSPLVPGTAGSLMGALVYLLLQHLSYPVFIGMVVLISVSGIFIADEAEKLYGKKDCPCIVIDEIAGMLTTLVLLPQGIGFLLAGFIAFRIFDILKPFPVGLAERRLPGGWGIMMDDILAGVYAGLVVRVGVEWGLGLLKR
ncbi:MAG: phosphatidylglycerophosphatase A [Nitrospirae bacterium]|nr:phosphatidylglycerophosphatase A [Nitrospirota bacterium]